MKNFSYIIKGNSELVLINAAAGKVWHAFRATHGNFDEILSAIRGKDFERAQRLVDKASLVSAAIDSVGDDKVGSFALHDNQVFYVTATGEKPIHSVLTKRIVEMAAGGFDVNPMLRFMRNLYENPSKTAIDELYLFLEHHDLPITDDGCFLAYKRVRSDFRDIYSGTLDNRPGSVVSMPRNEVDDKRANTCSTGLHFCSREYLNSFKKNESDRVIIVKINPRDVVSIPADHNNAKGRCCRYVVVAEYTGTIGAAAFNAPLVKPGADSVDNVRWAGDRFYFDSRVGRWRDAVTHRFVSSRHVQRGESEQLS